jgi:hypothetical protein
MREMSQAVARRQKPPCQSLGRFGIELLDLGPDRPQLGYGGFRPDDLIH